MFNVAIFKLKDVTKYLVLILIVIFFITISTKIFSLKKEIKITSPTSKIYKQAISKQIPLIDHLEQNQEEHNEENKEQKYAKIAIRDRNKCNKRNKRK